MIRALISVCPLLGLLGTVLGMIEVFEVTALIALSVARVSSERVGWPT
jgi:biopolymer transport protein ExbB